MPTKATSYLNNKKYSSNETLHSKTWDDQNTTSFTQYKMVDKNNLLLFISPVSIRKVSNIFVLPGTGTGMQPFVMKWNIFSVNIVK